MTTWKPKMCSSENESEGSMQLPFSINMATEMNQPVAGIRVVENQIFFYGEIDDSSCLELNKVLFELDVRLQNLKNALGSDYNPVIHLHINTYGGSIYAAFSTVDTIKNLKSLVYTYADGIVASAGTLITLSGSKRYVGRHAHMLIHQLSSGVYGTFSDIEANYDSLKTLMKMLKDFYKKTTKVPMKKLDELMTKDIYLTSEECLSYGIVDEIR